MMFDKYVKTRFWRENVLGSFFVFVSISLLIRGQFTETIISLGAWGAVVLIARGAERTLGWVDFGIAPRDLPGGL